MASSGKLRFIVLTTLALLCSAAFLGGCASKRPGAVVGGTVGGASSGGGKATLIFDW